MTAPTYTALAQEIEDAYGITVDDRQVSVSGTDFLGRKMVWYGSHYAGCVQADGTFVANSRNWSRA